MQTRNVELANQWALITAGPASYISFEPSRNGKNSSIQVAISSALPSEDVTGHLVTALMGAELEAGENLYAKSNGQHAVMIVTDTLATGTFSAPPRTGMSKDAMPVATNNQSIETQKKNEPKK